MRLDGFGHMVPNWLAVSWHVENGLTRGMSHGNFPCRHGCRCSIPSAEAAQPRLHGHRTVATACCMIARCGLEQFRRIQSRFGRSRRPHSTGQIGRAPPRWRDAFRSETIVDETWTISLVLVRSRNTYTSINKSWPRSRLD